MYKGARERGCDPDIGIPDRITSDLNGLGFPAVRKREVKWLFGGSRTGQYQYATKDEKDFAEKCTKYVLSFMPAVNENVLSASPNLDSEGRQKLYEIARQELQSEDCRRYYLTL